jgi:hypothetical protein
MIPYQYFGRAVLLAVAILFAGGANAQPSASAPTAGEGSESGHYQGVEQSGGARAQAGTRSQGD